MGRTNDTVSDALRGVYDALDRQVDLLEVIHVARDAYGVDHVTYHLGRTADAPVDAPYVKTTYSAEWLSRYVLMGYARVDPVVREGLTRSLPFEWSELALTADAGQLMQEAMQYGLGPYGYTVPVVDRSARRAIFSINTHAEPDRWRALIDAHGAEFAEIAQRIHRRAVAEVYGAVDPVQPLGPREIECLQWTSQGKDMATIADILGLSTHTVASYLKSARYKLDSPSVAAAVAKAIRLRLIDP